jgi:hypothetical protein
MRRRSAPALLVLVTCLAASVCYIGTVTEGALVTLLLPTVAVVGLLAVRLSDRPLRALVLVLVVTAVASEAVNIASGAYQGPAARSTGVAALATGLAVVLSGTRRPASFLLPVVAVVTWSLALGAGGQVQLLAVITAGLALLALAAVEREQRAFVVPPRWSASLLLALLLVIGAGVFASLFQLHNDGRRPASPFQQTLARTVTPPSFLSLSTRARASRAPTDEAAQLSSSQAAPQHPAVAGRRTRVRRILRDLLWALVAVLLAALLAVAVRLTWAAWAWRRLYRHLARSTAQLDANAWLWTVAHLSRSGVVLAAQDSPDRVAAETLCGLGDPLRETLQRLARNVALSVFAAPGSVAACEDIWSLAHETADTAWASASKPRRAYARWRLPDRAWTSKRHHAAS